MYFLIYLKLQRSFFSINFFFFFNDTATTEIYTLSLHDALPISEAAAPAVRSAEDAGLLEVVVATDHGPDRVDRKSTRLNSSHQIISYAVFCLKKKKNNIKSHHNNKNNTQKEKN